MPAVLSVTMAVGARNLAKKQAIVTRLSAMEEMAGIDVLCADKTGTLTQNILNPGRAFLRGRRRCGRGGRERPHWHRSAERQDAIDLAVLSGLKGAAGAEARSCISALRSRAQAERGHGAGRTGRVQGDQRRAAGDHGAVRRSRDARAQVEKAIDDICGARISFARRGAHDATASVAIARQSSRSSIRRARTRRRRSRPRAQWASTSRW